MNEIAGAELIYALSVTFLGALLCFAGYRLFKAVLSLLGFTFGGLLGGWGGWYASGGDELMALGAFLVAGLIAALLIRSVYKLSLFLLGAAGGVALGLVLGVSLELVPRILIVAAAGALSGVLILKLERVMVCFATSAVGALGATGGIALLALGADRLAILESRARQGAASFELVDWVLVGLWALLVVSGVVSQLRGAKKKS